MKSKKDNQYSKTPEHYTETILPQNIVDEMKSSFIEYSMSVITSRALPDIRDGLKPVHRRILYAMRGMGLTSGAKFRKSATVVGEVLGKYHPHGDSSVYEAMVNMAQEFSTRYPLVIGQGNFGSLDGDGAAAHRYTEAKMSKISEELLRDIEKETVDFQPNYDGERKEPRVLPASVPNLLLNGVLGIAVGMATNIPPHNLTEVLDATLHLADNPDATTEDLLQFVKGPDFPLGGLAFNKKDISIAYATGRGGVVCRGEAEIIESKNGKFEIMITSIPYRVNRSNLIVKIAELVQEKKLLGIKDIRDESAEDTRIVIELKTGVSPERTLNYIYKHTELESAFNYNMTALIDGVPQTVSLKDILREFIKHRKEIVRRRTEFELKKAKARAHILEGLKKALDHIDEVIKIIKASKDVNDARANLMAKFKFSEIQAVAILEMRLQKLANLERKAIEDELNTLMKFIKDCEDILSKPARILKIVKEEITSIKEKYGDERRTKIMARAVGNISDEDLVIEKDTALVMTSSGYIKRTDPSEYRTQNRGGVGVHDLNTKDEDIVTTLLVGNTKSDCLFFTDKGRVYSIKMYELPEGGRSTKGKSINNFISLTTDEKIASILVLPKDIKQSMDNTFVAMATQNGTIKKVSLDSFSAVRRSGIIAINLKDSDTLLGAYMVRSGDGLSMLSADGIAIAYLMDDIRPMGRTAGGVRGMTLKKKDKLVSCAVLPQEMVKVAKILVISKHGYGKMTNFDEYKLQKRGGSGIKTMQVTEKTGPLAGGAVVLPTHTEMIVVSENGITIRMELSDIPTLGRATQGVRVMKLKDGDSLSGTALL